MSGDIDEGEGGRFAAARRLAEQAVRAQSEGDDATADRLFAEANRIDPQAVAAVLEEAVADRQPPPAPQSDADIAAMSRTVRPHADAPSRAGITPDGSGADSER